MNRTQVAVTNATPAINLPIKFRTEMRNTVWDVLRDRGWKEVDGTDNDWDFHWAQVNWIHEQYYFFKFNSNL
jgi:tubulin polyglutamylase TTLL9